MADENLVKYIKDGLAQGRTEDILRPLLLAAGWQPQVIDEAFATAKGVASPAPVASPISVMASTPVSAADSSRAAQISSRQPQGGHRWFWTAGVAVAVMAVVGGGWAAYAYFMAPSPQQVLDQMFQSGLSGMTSADNTTMVALDVHLTSASTTVSSNMTNPYASMLLDSGGGTFLMQASSSGSFATDSTGSRNVDQHVGVSINVGTTGETFTMTGAGEVRTVDGVTYLNLGTIPNLGIFNLSSLEGKWIKLQADTSTASLAENLIGAPSLSVPSSTLSPADLQKIVAATEQAITITKTLPDETVGGVNDYHYQYVINRQGAQNAAIEIATIAAHSLQGASSTLDASTTASINEGVANFFGAFTSMGGDLWIGKSDHYLHQATLDLAFSTSTPFGNVDGTVGVTNTLSNINGQQAISIPSGAEDIQTVMQSILSASPALNATQVAGRDARRVSDLHEIQNALELYYNKCGYYPGTAAGAAGQACSSMHTRITTFAALSAALRGSSSLGVTMVPNDPSMGATYYYGTDAAGTRYILAARMEDRTDPVFTGYVPPSLAGISISGVASCAAPMYCVSL